MNTISLLLTTSLPIPLPLLSQTCLRTSSATSPPLYIPIHLHNSLRTPSSTTTPRQFHQVHYRLHSSCHPYLTFAVFSKQSVHLHRVISFLRPFRLWPKHILLIVSKVRAVNVCSKKRCHMSSRVTLHRKEKASHTWKVLVTLKSRRMRYWVHTGRICEHPSGCCADFPLAGCTPVAVWQVGQTPYVRCWEKVPYVRAFPDYVTLVLEGEDRLTRCLTVQDKVIIPSKYEHFYFIRQAHWAKEL